MQADKLPPYTGCMTPMPAELPTYNSLFLRIKSAQTTSTSKADFARTATCMLFTSVGFTIVIGILMLVPVAHLIIGAIYINDCRYERYIPIYLIVFGAFSLLKGVFTIIKRVRHPELYEEDADDKQCTKSGFAATFIGCFLFAWFIAGNVWVYSIYNTWSSDVTQPTYCHPTLYLYAFWATTATYILVGFSCLFCCVSTCVLACLSETGKSEIKINL